MRVVFDTNVYVSQILHGGLPAQVLRAAVQARFSVCVSAQILSEVREVLLRHGVRASQVNAVVREINRLARTVTVQGDTQFADTLTAKDNQILATAVAANADYLVTGDRQIRKLGRIRRTHIVTPREFWTVLIHAGYVVRADY